MGVAAAAGLVAYGYAHWVERVLVSLHRATLLVNKPGLPPAGVTILHLSDFHFRAEDSVQEARLARLRALLAREHYDVLALTGDLIHNEAGLPRALAFLAELRPSVAAFSIPGNRDYWESSFKAVLTTRQERARLTPSAQRRLILAKTRRMLRMFAGNERAALGLHRNDVDRVHAALQALGIQPLVNRAVNLRCAGADLWFAGVDDLTQGRPDLAAALADVPPGAPLVLLAHNPDVWLDPALRASTASGPAVRRSDLMLSGHTHGGQLNLPFVGAWYRQGTHLGRRKPAGWFHDGASHLFVSRGLGESFPFRIGAPPEAALIRLLPDGRI